MKYEQPFAVSDPNAAYVNGNPQIGLQGSIPPAAAIEYPQREIVNFITKSNIVPTDADLTQLTQSARSQFVNFANDTGSENTLSVSFDPPILSYTVGLLLRVRVAVTNTGSSTINAGPGAVLIKRSTGLSATAGDLPGGGVVSLVYDGSAFQIVNSAGYGGSTGGGPPPVVSAIPYTVDTSAVANTITAPFSPSITTLTAGTIVLVKVANTNTGPTIINVNAINNIPVKANGHGPLLPGDIAAGDVKLFVYDGTSFWITPNFAASAATGHGRCYLSLSGSNLLLAPMNGNGITINGALYSLPSAGITLAPGGAGSVVNYIYAYVGASGTVVLEASTIAPALNTDGVMIKTGDPTRSLVGKAYVNQYGQWQDQNGFIGVLSWFNRRVKISTVLGQAGNAFSIGASSTWIEVSTTYRNYFLCWSGDTPEAQWYGIGGGIGSSNGNHAVSFDGASPPDFPWYNTDTPTFGGGGNYSTGIALTIEKNGLIDGALHYATPMCLCWAGTLQILSQRSDGHSGTALTVITRG